MDADEQDMQDAAEHAQQTNERQRRECSGWEWWPSYQDEVVARRLAEAAQLKALCWALDKLFRA